VLRRVRRARASAAAAVVLLAAALGGCGGEPEVFPLAVSSMGTPGSPGVSLRVVPPPELRGGRLRADEFVVRQDGEARPADVERIDPSLVEVAVVVDLAGEPGERRPLTDIRPAAAAFLLGLPAGVRFTMVDAGAPAVEPVAGDIATAIGRVRAMEAPVRSDLVGAIETAVGGLSTAPEASRNVVVLTIGRGRLDAKGLERLGTTLAERGVAVHVLGITTLTTLTDLDELAAATGGSVALADDALGVADAGAETIDTLVDGYRIDFDPSGTGATEVEVELHHGDVVARAVLTLSLETE
jgi:hypothetical protein